MTTPTPDISLDGLIARWREELEPPPEFPDIKMCNEDVAAMAATIDALQRLQQIQEIANSPLINEHRGGEHGHILIKRIRRVLRGEG